MAYSHDSFIVNSKTFSIVITIINSKIFSDGVYSFDSYGVSVGFGFDNSKASNSFVAWLCMDCERVSTGTSLYDSTPL